MSEAKHTPGPWRLEADPMHFDSLTTITGGQRMNAKPHAWPAYPLTVQVGGMASVKEAQANAALLAAAPELLEALVALLPHVPGHMTNNLHGRPWIEQARAAIAKATAHKEGQ